MLAYDDDDIKAEEEQLQTITNENHNLCCQQGISHCSITTGVNTEDISRWNCDLDELNLGAEKRLIKTIVSNVKATPSTHPR